MLDGLYQILQRLDGYSPWKVLIQLVLIWIVVYVVFRFLRGTRGARALQGVFLVLVVAMIAGSLVGADTDYAPLHYLLQGFLQFTVLALVIVFQPEIRRALVRLGEARFFRGANVAVDSVIDELVDAAEYLSKHKIGAILAVERSVGLEGVVQAGTRIDGRVSADLIKSLFWPGTALHDMGVVVRGDRIVAAGVQFPLAEGEEISQDLGSRHRAAVGLSQEADCLVIVISEETGAISVAERGQLLRKLSVEGLRALLRKGLSHAPSPPPVENGGSDGSLPSSQEDGSRDPSTRKIEDQEPPIQGKTAA